jgi:Zn-dependent M28 family amino/carboxypeptidase
LFGSEAYVEQPLFPLNKTVAMLNLDMIGRNGIDTLYVVGAPKSPDLAKINEDENRSSGFVLSLAMEKYFAQSDHATFYKKKIPILFYHSGDHPDLHKVTDSPDLINTEKAAKISRLAFRAAWRIANEDKYYKLISK